MDTPLSHRAQAMLELTLELVNICSVSKTAGENRVSDYMYTLMQSWPYFQQHPDYVQAAPLEDDPVQRRNILALVKGEAAPSSRTLMYLSHLDTVDIEDYGELRPWACDPPELQRRLAERELPPDVRQDLASGEWLFGRGTADMKSGVAIQLRLLKEFSERVTEFSGNIILVITVDEEADSLGMLGAAKPLMAFSETHNLDILGAINTDYVTQREPGDPQERCIYVGSLGKIVPAVYAVGKASHVGQVFEGFDVNQFLSHLTARLDVNMAFADQHGEYVTQPPISLKQTDLKTEYSGQLPCEGFAYYNFLNVARGPQDVMELMCAEARQSFDECVAKLNAACRQYSQMWQRPDRELSLHPQVLTYEELYAAVCEQHCQSAVEAAIQETLGQSQADGIVDLRIHSLRLVQKLWYMSQRSGPAAVIFLAPPYYPAHNLDVDDAKFTTFHQHTERVAQRVQTTISDYQFTILPFFPYLSDASFCAYQEDDSQEQALTHNMPYWGKGWQIAIPELRRLNIPVVDMGVHGKNAHHYLERVHIPYTFEALPNLIEQMTIAVLTEND